MGNTPKRGRILKDLLPYTTTKYQIAANSIEKRAQEPQNTDNWGYPYMGAIRTNGPILIIFCGEICCAIRTQSTKFQRIRMKNALKNPKIPKIVGTLIWGLAEKMDLYL